VINPLGRRARKLALGVTASAVASLAVAGTALADTTPTFVIGGQNLPVGTQVAFWGAQWWNENPLSTGFAPPSFKGFVDNPPAGCGSSWTTDPGNSSNPPATLPATVDAVVSSTITKSGPIISGDTVAIALVAPDAGYAGDPGHPGTGTIVGYVCGGPGGPSNS
jgi:hypothetical protein